MGDKRNVIAHFLVKFLLVDLEWFQVIPLTKAQTSWWAVAVDGSQGDGVSEQEVQTDTSPVFSNVFKATPDI